MSIAPVPMTNETQPFWDAAGEGKFLLPHCDHCSRFQWPPATFCPHCDGKIGWKAASGRGAVESFSVVHRPPSKTAIAAEPYILAFIKLDEGVRFFTRLTGCTPDGVALRMRVKVSFEKIDGGEQAMPVFAPDPASGS